MVEGETFAFSTLNPLAPAANVSRAETFSEGGDMEIWTAEQLDALWNQERFEEPDAEDDTVGG